MSGGIPSSSPRPWRRGWTSRWRSGRRRGGALVRDAALDVGDHFAHRADVAEILVRDLDVERLLDPEQQLDHRERVQAEVFAQLVVEPHLRRVALEVLGQRRADVRGDFRLNRH